MGAHPGRRSRAIELKDRRRERSTLDRLIEAVRAGQSQALVVRGDPGVGKTVLLDYLAGRASGAGCRVAHAVGVQSEMELAYAGVHQLCAPMLGRAKRLPVPQHDALRTAGGRAAGHPGPGGDAGGGGRTGRVRRPGPVPASAYAFGGYRGARRQVRRGAVRLGQDPPRAEPLTAEKLREFAAGRLARYKVPRYVIVVDEFPLTVTGKVRKLEMREKSVGLLALEDAAAIRHA